MITQSQQENNEGEVEQKQSLVKAKSVHWLGGVCVSEILNSYPYLRLICIETRWGGGISEHPDLDPCIMLIRKDEGAHLMLQ